MENSIGRLQSTLLLFFLKDFGSKKIWASRFLQFNVVKDPRQQKRSVEQAFDFFPKELGGIIENSVITGQAESARQKNS